MNNNQHRIVVTITSVVVIILCVMVIISGVNIKNRLANLDDTNQGNTDPDPDPAASEPEPDNSPIPETPPVAPFINLQSQVESWAQSLNTGTKAGVMIYDLTRNRTAATYHADEIFNIASIYKLLFAYDGYRQIALGLEDANRFYTRTADKGNLTISACLDLIVRESYNGCADRMIRDHARLQRVSGLITEVGMSNTSGIGLESTAADITKLLLFYWRHSDLPEELWNQITDSMLRQPPSLGDDGKLYDWRQGLPAGFSPRANVYNKVGWAWEENHWNTYADAAIVDFTELNHTYIIVILTSNLSTASQISRLGATLEQTILSQSNP